MTQIEEDIQKMRQQWTADMAELFKVFGDSEGVIKFLSCRVQEAEAVNRNGSSAFADAIKLREKCVQTDADGLNAAIAKLKGDSDYWREINAKMDAFAKNKIKS